jgi:hypothetical protein
MKSPTLMSAAARFSLSASSGMKGGGVVGSVAVVSDSGFFDVGFLNATYESLEPRISRSPFAF